MLMRVLVKFSLIISLITLNKHAGKSNSLDLFFTFLNFLKYLFCFVVVSMAAADDIQ